MAQRATSSHLTLPCLVFNDYCFGCLPTSLNPSFFGLEFLDFCFFLGGEGLFCFLFCCLLVCCFSISALFCLKKSLGLWKKGILERTPKTESGSPKPHPSKPHPCNMPQAKTEVALQISESCAAEVALQHLLFCSVDVIVTKSCAAASEKLQRNIEKAALQESGAFLLLSADFRLPRLGPADRIGFLVPRFSFVADLSFASYFCCCCCCCLILLLWGVVTLCGCCFLGLFSLSLSPSLWLSCYYWFNCLSCLVCFLFLKKTHLFGCCCSCLFIFAMYNCSCSCSSVVCWCSCCCRRKDMFVLREFFF